MSVKKILLQKQIEGVIYDIYTKTDASIVVYDKSGTATTVAAELAALASAIDELPTDDNVDAKIKELRDEIYGLAEGESLNEAFDTLKEISAYLAEHPSVVEGFTSDISALKTALGAPAQGETAASGLFATVAGIDSRLQDVEGAMVTASTTNGNIKIGTQEVTVYDESALAQRVKDLEDADTDVVDGDTNGTIKVDGEVITVYDGDASFITQDATHRFVSDTEKATWNAKVGSVTDTTAGDGKIEVDGEEMVVYTHPETHAATMITEDATHRFVSDTEKAAWNAKAEVEVVSALPQSPVATTLYMVELA